MLRWMGSVIKWMESERKDKAGVKVEHRSKKVHENNIAAVWMCDEINMLRWMGSVIKWMESERKDKAGVKVEHRSKRVHEKRYSSGMDV